MKKLGSRGRWLTLWLAMCVVLYAGCGIMTTGSKEQQEAINQAMAEAASLAVEESSSVSREFKPEESSSVSQESKSEESSSTSQEPKSEESSSMSQEPKSEESSSVSQESKSEEPSSISQEPEVLDENGSYTTCEDVALYLETYEHLPGNFITKKEARALGWEGGSLEPYAPGKCIGGDRFGNYEKLLPEAEGRSYRECDIDTLGADSRGAKRIVYSDDGLIYYTEDHYASFTLLYD